MCTFFSCVGISIYVNFTDWLTHWHLALFSFVKTYMFVYSPVCSCMVLYGLAWSYLVLYGHVWSWMVLCGRAIESSHTCIRLTGGSRGSFSPDLSRSCPVKGGVPCWKNEVEPQRQESLFWHAEWRSAGSPKEGPLHHSMKTSIKLYRYLIRKVKKRSELKNSWKHQKMVAQTYRRKWKRSGEVRR